MLPRTRPEVISVEEDLTVIRYRCATCGGTGIHSLGDTCVDCDGTGIDNHGA
jgi:DnaJ-class molecular chaperone